MASSTDLYTKIYKSFYLYLRDPTKTINMSAFIKNKDIIHITTEVVVITGVCFYFSRKVNTLKNNIDILSHKLEEQQAIINKHEEIINQLVFMIQNGSAPSPPRQVSKPMAKAVPAKPKQTSRSVKKVAFNLPLCDNEEQTVERSLDDDEHDELPECKELTEEELDEELKEELKDLEVTEGDDDENIDNID